MTPQSAPTRTRHLVIVVMLVVTLWAVAARATGRTSYQASDFGPLPPVPTPVDNPITADKVELGRMLYFDPRMSADGSLSCNSCHSVDTGWTSPATVSFAGPGTSHWRNSSTILNVGYYNALNWDGGKKSIEAQNAGAWGGSVAGNLDRVLAEERLAQIPDYVERFRNIFGTTWPTWDNALRALAAFQRTIVSQNVPIDAFAEGNRDALSDEAARGFDLFVGAAACVTCHTGPLFSDNSFHALGVPQNPDFETRPLLQITFRFEQLAKGAPEEVYRNGTDDLGLFYVTKLDSDRGKFRTPGLRDVCYTAPYMHNGVFPDLESVVEFYVAGGGDASGTDALLTPLTLTAEEISQVVAFLEEGLCGDRVTVKTPTLPPYGTFPAPQE